MKYNVAMRNHSPFYCLIPGSFRPPHQGHYEMISHYQSLASEVGGKVIVMVSKPSKKNERLTGSGQVITPQFAKEKLHEMFGDSIKRKVSIDEKEIEKLVGKKVIIKFKMTDAKLYSLTVEK